MFIVYFSFSTVAAYMANKVVYIGISTGITQLELWSSAELLKSLRHFAHRSPNFTRGQIVQNVASIFDNSCILTDCGFKTEELLRNLILPL